MLAKLLSTTAAAGIFVLGAGTAAAQQAASSPTTDTQDAAEATSSDDIIVTAQRRSERLIDVPQSVTAVDGSQLTRAGSTDSMELGQVVPGLTMTQGGVAPGQPSIRGVGTSLTAAGSSSTVAVYIDGVYQLSQSGAAFDLNNIEGVEVLKGPQGALYGRNSTGGAILVTTRRPSTVAASGNVALGYGNFNAFTANGYLNLPITDQLAVNFTGGFEDSDGYVRDIVRNKRLGDSKSFDLMGKARFEIADNADITLSLHHKYRSDPNPFNSNALNGNAATGRTIPGTVVASRPHEVALSFDPFIRSDYNAGNVTVNFETGGYKIKSITSITDNWMEFLADTDFTPPNSTSLYSEFKERTVSQDLIISSPDGGAFSWIAGLLYSHEAAIAAVPARNTVGYVDVDIYSGFAEATLELTPGLSVTAGGRYTYENLMFSATNAGVPATFARTNSGAFTPQVSVKWRASDDTNLYATYSQGYRSGGWNSTSLDPTPFLPEHVTAYEVGIKSSAMRSLTLSAAAYYYDFKDIQFQAGLLTGTTYRTFIYNAAAARTYGGEMEFDWRATRSLSVRGGLSYNDARYTDFPNALVTTPIFGGGNVQAPRQVRGNRTIRTPELSGNLSLNYTTELDPGKFDVSVNANYQSRTYFDPGNRISQPQRVLLNARIGFTPSAFPVGIEVWAKNIGDVDYIASISDSAAGDRTTWGAPRTYGVTLRASF